MNKLVKRIAVVTIGITIGLTTLAGCSYSDEYENRKEQEETVQLDGESLSRQNQEERLKREENDAQIRYVYVFPLAASKPLGYFTVNGKVSSAGVQNAPEQDIICRRADSCVTVDSAKDDGTFGPSEDGFFFFNTDDILIEGEGFAYFQSDSPIALYADVPLIEPAQLQQ